MLARSSSHASVSGRPAGTLVTTSPRWPAMLVCHPRHVRGSPARSTGGPANAFGGFRPSLDPLANQPPRAYQPGEVFSVHNPTQLSELLELQKARLVVVQAKSSFCKPCKKFAKTYMAFAEHMKDTVFVVITGDENIDNRKLMKDWGVRVTPTFRLYRDGVYTGVSVTGTKPKKLADALAAHLLPGETTPAGLVFEVEEELEEAVA